MRATAPPSARQVPVTSPTVAEYMEAVGVLNKDSENIYKYLNFDQIEEYLGNAKETTA